MPNIKFNYHYRDSGNYKNCGFVIFANPCNLDLPDLEKRVRAKLIWGEWFYAEEWRITELFFECIDFRVEPTWHEFECIEYTNDPPTQSISIVHFMKLIEKTLDSNKI